MQAEATGAALYETWASHAASPQAAALLRQNAQDEAGNRERAKQALALLDD